MTDGAPADAPDTSTLPDHGNRDALWALFRRDSFAASVGATLEDWGPGWSRYSWTPADEHSNFAGSVHGGAVFTLGDAAFAVACNSWGRAAVALSVDIHYLSAVSPGERLVAIGVEHARTRRTGSYRIAVHTADRQVGSLQAMAFRTGAWHLGEDAWPDDWRALA